MEKFVDRESRREEESTVNSFTTTKQDQGGRNWRG